MTVQEYFNMTKEEYEMREKEETRAALEYLEKFRDGLCYGLMPEEDRARYVEIAEECIRTGKPYDNYVKFDPNDGTTQDYGI